MSQRSSSGRGGRDDEIGQVRLTYSVEEAATMLGISRSLAYQCVKTGEIPSLKFRRRIVIPAHVIDGLMQAA